MSYIDLKPEKHSVIHVETTLGRRDMFLWLPTGYGKSLCYYVLPFMFDHRQGLVNIGRSCAALVISPLLTLMVNQVTSDGSSLRGRSIECSLVILNDGGIDCGLLATEGSLISDLYTRGRSMFVTQ